MKLPASAEHWIANEQRMNLAKPTAQYMHCLPCEHGAEVTDGVLDGKWGEACFNEAENRLHAQKGVMAANHSLSRTAITTHLCGCGQCPQPPFPLPPTPIQRGIFMSTVAPGLFYSKEDEWLRLDGDEAVVGISDYAQDALSDIVYLEVPEVGATYEQGDVFGVVESVKAAADLYMYGGEITAVNLDLVSDRKSSTPLHMTPGWCKYQLNDPAQAQSLMDAQVYAAYRNIN